MVHFARVAGLDDQRAARARALAHEVMVHARRRQQARDRRQSRADAAVRQDQDVEAGRDRLARAAAQLVHRLLEPRRRPVSGSNSIDSVVERNGESGGRWRSFATCSLWMIGYLILICRHDSGSGFSRLRSGPIVEPMSVTSSSRIASSGGFVTCANSCLK